MYTDLLVPTDGSKLSAKAILQALPLAKALKARVVVLATPICCRRLMAEPGVLKQRAEHNNGRARGRYVLPRRHGGGGRLIADRMVSDSPWQAIIAAAKAQKCDAIVMASHGRHGVSGLLLGSETQKVLTHSTIPVLVLR
jgi:nucleotide-binding universal stress UspA family protein